MSPMYRVCEKGLVQSWECVVQVCVRSFYTGDTEHKASSESRLSLMKQIKKEWVAAQLMSMEATETSADIISEVKTFAKFCLGMKANT